MDFSSYRFIAHRGLYDNQQVPENSLPAFLDAVRQDYAIELDVHLTTDEKLAVFHDAHLKRMTGVEGYVENCDAATLQQMRLLDTECRIPMFQEVLELVDGKVPLLIEIKDESFQGKTVARLVRQLKDYQGEYLIESFNPYVVYWLRRHAQTIVRGQLAAAALPELSKIKCWALKHMIFNFWTKPDFIAYDVHDIDECFLKKCRCGKGLFAWTIRTPEECEKARQCDGLIFEGFDIRHECP